MLHADLLDTGQVEGEGQGILDVGGGHGWGPSPGDDVARKVVQHGTQIVPAPADDLELREIRLPHFIHSLGRVYVFRTNWTR